MTSRLKIIAGGMIALGVLLAAIGFFSGGKWIIFKDDKGFYVPNKHTLVHKSYNLDAFTSIKVFNDFGDVEIVDGDSYSLEVNSLEDAGVTYSVKKGTLTVETKSKKKNRISIGFTSYETPSIKIIVPKDEALTSIIIDSNFGDTSLQGLHYQQLNLMANYGDIEFKNIVGEQTEITQAFGDMTLQQFSSNGFVAESEHGDIDIDGTLNGQSTVTSSFGDTTLQLQNNKSELGFELKTDFGDITVNNQSQDHKVSQLHEGDNQLKVSLSHGDLDLSLD